VLAIPPIDDEHRELAARSLQNKQGRTDDGSVWRFRDEQMMTTYLPHGESFVDRLGE
jgi:hypothetical protein